MASDLISRKALLEDMVDIEEKYEDCMTEPTFATAYRVVREQPTVDAVEVVHGEWEVCEDDWNEEVTYKCSNCGDELVSLFGFEIDWNYCPNCGADMRVGRWKGEGMGDYSCSLCGEVVSGNYREKCPNCHAKLNGGDKA